MTSDSDSDKPFRTWKTTQPVSLVADDGDTVHSVSDGMLYAYAQHFIHHFERDREQHKDMVVKAMETHVLEYPVLIGVKVDKDWERPASFNVDLEVLAMPDTSMADVTKLASETFDRLWNESSECIEKTFGFIDDLSSLEGLLKGIFRDLS